MKDSKIEMSDEFKDIEQESKYKNYIIVGILYVFVIILTILLVLGIKNQKDVVENSLKENSTIESGR